LNRRLLATAAVLGLALSGFCCENKKNAGKKELVADDGGPGPVDAVPDGIGDTGDLPLTDGTGGFDLVETVDGREDLGPQPAPPMKYSGGTCPAFQAGKNTFEVDGRQRSFELYLPEEPEGAPLVYVWHGNGGNGRTITSFFMGQAAAKEYGAIVVGPYNCCSDGYTECCDMLMTWNYGEFSKLEADLTLFDDILACIDEQYDIDNRRVYTTGFSAGSLWSTYLLLHRSDQLAAAALFSGGTGLVIPYVTPAHKLPVLLAWGGENDTYMNMVDFDEMTLELSQYLQEDGHFVVECNHGPYSEPGAGHTIPYDGPAWGYKFLFPHTWGDGHSPLAATGLSDDFPDYCLIPGE